MIVKPPFLYYMLNILAAIADGAKNKLAVLLDSMINKIQEELEDIVGMINTVLLFKIFVF